MDGLYVQGTMIKSIVGLIMYKLEINSDLPG